MQKAATSYLLTNSIEMSTDKNEDAAGSPKRQRLDEKVATIGTHSGTFHCDDVLACFMLKQLPEYADAEIFRSRDDSELQEKCDIIVDVGGVFDHEKKWYDHHQNTFNETLSTLKPEFGETFNKIKLSSAGLIYGYYGERVIGEILKKHADITLSTANLDLTYMQLYRTFISEIDAIDNGVPVCQQGVEPMYKISTGISRRVENLNPSWDEEDSDVNLDEIFLKAMAYVGKEFIDNVVAIGGSWIKAREYVREGMVLATSVHESGEIVVLPKFCPWKQHLFDLEEEYDSVGLAKLIIFVDKSGQWCVAGVPETPDSYRGRKYLPETWRGLCDEELSNVAGIKDLVFVHHSGFIGGAKSKEAVLEMAIKCIE